MKPICFSHTESLGTDPFKVELTSESTSVRAWTQFFDRNDGSIIVRYKMFKTSKHIDIRISWNGQLVGKSPYTLKGRWKKIDFIGRILVMRMFTTNQ